MIIHSKYVFIHLPKCGGTFITQFLLEGNSTIQGKKKGNIHQPVEISRRPAQSNKVYFTSIRNPFSYYVSLWSYGCQKKGYLYRYIAKYFPHRLNWYQSKNIQGFQKWLTFILQLDHPAEMKKYDIGLFTYRFISISQNNNFSLLSNPDQDPMEYRYIKIENMNSDLVSVMKQIFPPTQYPEIKKKIHKLQSGLLDKKYHKNSTSHRPYREYYNSATQKLVYQKDRYLFDKFEYIF